jgi:LAO/AO transport system kinase
LVNSESLIESIKTGDKKSLARAISWVENNVAEADGLLKDLTFNNTPVIGITGPPGAGKSTLLNSILKFLSENNKKVAVVAVDPTSPFNHGSLLGDRIRMSNHFLSDNIFIRSLATRGSLGGLSEKTMEVTDLLRATNFDYIFVETVGVGQSEVEIAGLADTTVVVVVPESGDDIQAMKSGLLEIADIFVVNKADHIDADKTMKNLTSLVHEQPKKDWQIPVLKTTANTDEGVADLLAAIEKHIASKSSKDKKKYLMAEKAYRLIQQARMFDINRDSLLQEITQHFSDEHFNIYQFVQRYFS